MARREISAGCVVFRNAGNGVEVVLTRPRGRNAWALPKGNLQAGERAEDAARRETGEETGYTGTILGRIDTTKYTYTANWERPPARIFKIVTFYLMDQTGGDGTRHDSEVEQVEWFPLDEAVSKASYSTEKSVLRKARDLIGAAAKSR